MANIELTLTPASPTGSMIFTLGAPGPQGLAGTMTVGTVTTGAPGSSATIVNVGTPNAAILDFDIPQGDVGAQGDKGDKGDQGDPGTPGVIYATSPLSYNSGTQTVSIDLSAYATQSYVNGQGFITSSALAPYLTSATAASTYLAKSGGIITGDIQSNNGSGYRSWDGATNTTVLVSTYLQLNKAGAGGGSLTVEWDGITFQSGKQTQPFLGLAGYATEAWVTSGFLTKDGNLAGITNPATARSNLDLGSGNGVTFASATIQGSGANVAQLSPTSLTLNHTSYGQFTIQPSSGITFPDATIQTTAYTGGGGLITSVTSPLAVTSGNLSIDLTGYATESFVTSQGYITQITADGLYYPLTSNPSGFIDASALTGYATESWVYGQGFTTEAWVQSQGYLTSVPPPSLTGLAGDISWDSYSNTGRLLITGGMSSDGMFFSARLNFDNFVPNQPTLGDFWFNGTDFFYGAGGVKTIASQSWVTSYVSSLGFITSGALAPYAPLAGATFTGKVNMAAPTAGSASLNLGVGTVPTTSVAGDIWIGTNINYRDSVGTQKAVANTNTTNTFTQAQVISNSGNVTALRVTQTGTGNAIQVEDSTTPDATPFVVDQFGKVGIGVAPDATAAIKIDGNGMSFNGLVFNPTATAAHTGGANTLDLLVTINGVPYRLALRPA